MIQAFFRLQGIKVLWRLQFLECLRTSSLKFQKARTKTEVVLSLPSWLSQFSWDSQQGRLRTTSILVRAFWNFNLRSSNNPEPVASTIPWYQTWWNPLMYLGHGNYDTHRFPRFFLCRARPELLHYCTKKDLVNFCPVLSEVSRFWVNSQNGIL